jgi:hypothetical protein
MKNVLWTCVAALVVPLALTTGTASAQYQPPNMPMYQPGARPLLSPYLNLQRGIGSTTGTTNNNLGVDPAINYFLGTIPEFQRRANASLFRTEIDELERNQARRGVGRGTLDDEELLRPLRGTGHPTAFNNTGGYFNSAAGAPQFRRLPQPQQTQPRPR